jgi:hypothetical protein
MRKDTPQNVPRQPASLQKHRANKNGNINTTLFNFLENLLVFRTLEELSVPAESRVKFSISRQEGEPGICLLIHIDHEKFPIFEEGVPRPDYLAIYLHGDGCICTIIEMKSKENKNLEHGLDQIKSLADRLKTEFAEHLPPRFRLVIQGILLCRNNAQVPNPKILKMAQDGLTIFPALCDNRAELYPYVSREHKLKDGFKNNLRHPTDQSPVEEMMSRNTLNKRLSDNLSEARPGAGAGTGLHINFVLSDSDEYAVLMTRKKKCVFVVKEQGDEHQQRLLRDIVANGLEDKFDVEPMPE